MKRKTHLSFGGGDIVYNLYVYQGNNDITALVNSLPPYRKPIYNLMMLGLGQDYVELGSSSSAGRIYDVIASYHPYHEAGTCESQGWKNWDSSVTPDAHLRFNIKYADLDPKTIQEAKEVDGAYQLIYKTGNTFDNIRASGNIIVGEVVRGTVEANSDGDIILSIQKEWVDLLAQEENTSIAGDFYYQATFDLSELEKDETHKIKFGDIEFDIPLFDDPVARYGDINIDKAISNDIVVEDGKYFLEYTITIANGPDVMKDIEVKDIIQATNGILKDPNNKYYGVSYPTSTPEPIRVSTISSLSETKNNSSSVESFVYFNSDNNHTDHHENFTKYTPTASGNLVYYIPQMEENEVRTLTYRVELDPNFIGVHHWSDESLRNDAYLFSKGYPHKSDNANYDKNATANVRKRSSKIEPVTDSNGVLTHYLITYEATVNTPANNNYTLTNVLFWDSIKNNHTDFTKYGQYVKDSIKVNNQSVSEDDIHFEDAVTENDYTYIPGFNFSLGDMAPNTTKTVTYQVLFEAGHEAEANEAVINNTAKVFNDPSKRPDEAPHHQLSYWDVSVNPSGQVWERKLGGNRTTLSQTITMNPNDPVYDPKQTDSSTGLYKEISNPGSFVVNSGSYEFTIILNEKGQWALEGLTLRDESDKNGDNVNYLVFNGYLRIDVYDNLGSNLESYNQTHANVKRSIWVKVDNDTSFNLDGNLLGLQPNTNETDAYVIHYYAKANPALQISEININNNFSMSGTAVGPGGNSVTLDGITVRKSAYLVGEYAFRTVKEFWYYDENDPDFYYVNADGERVNTGALYWAIRVDGSLIKANTRFQESVNSYESYLNILRRNQSFIGFYVGNIEGLTDKISDKKLSEVFDNKEEMISSNTLKEVDATYDAQYTSGNNTNGWPVKNIGAYGETLPSNRGLNFDLTLKLEETISLDSGESLYLIVKTEPYRLPDNVDNFRTINYKNKVNIWDPIAKKSDTPYGNWPSVETSTKLSQESSGLDKTAGSVFQVKNNGIEFYKVVDGKREAYPSPTFQSSNNSVRANFELQHSILMIGNSFEELNDQLVNNASLKDPFSNLTNVNIANDQALNYHFKDGTYVTYHLKVNSTQTIAGAYTLIDTLPEGLELAYARTYRVGGRNEIYTSDVNGNNVNAPYSVKGNYQLKQYSNQRNLNVNNFYTGEKAGLLEDGWKRSVVLSNQKDKDYWLTTATVYYTKDNQVLFYFPRIKDNRDWFEMQLVCKVTDPNIYFEDVEFYNTATLYNARNREVDSDSAKITAYNGSLTKADLAGIQGSGQTIDNATIPYIIKVNETGMNMDEKNDTMIVPLIDTMSSNLSPDTSSLNIYEGDPVVDESAIVFVSEDYMVPFLYEGKQYYVKGYDGNAVNAKPYIKPTINGNLVENLLYSGASITIGTQDLVVGNIFRKVKTVEGDLDLYNPMTIRVAIENDVDEQGVATGKTNMLFHNLPDEKALSITYNVSATLTIGSGNSVSNDVHWKDYESSSSGNTSADNLTFEAGGTMGSIQHGAVRVTKYDAKDTTQKLQGAAFALFRADYQNATYGKLYVKKNGVLEKVSQAEIDKKNYPGVFYENGTPDDETDDIEVRVDRDEDGSVINFYNTQGQVISSSEYSSYRHHASYEANTNNILLDADYDPHTHLPIVYVFQDNHQLYYEHNADGERILDPNGYEGYKTTLIENDDPCLNPHVLAYDVTDSNGVATYGLADDQEKIHFNKIYGVVEAKAPQGYDIDKKEYFFVVPHETQSGIGLNYFYHENGVWPSNVHIVQKTVDDKPTFLLSVYDTKGSVGVEKDFGGVSEASYVPGTYRFGIWDDASLLNRLEIKTITYSDSDFGYYQAIENTTNKAVYKAYRKIDSEWYTLTITYDKVMNQYSETTWIKASISKTDTPANCIYGILPGHNKTVFFDNLDFNKYYYVYELSDDNTPIIPNANGNKSDVIVNNQNFDVSYTLLEDYGSHASYNKMQPYSNEHGVAVSPILKTTNTSYEAVIEKTFYDLNGQLITSGLIGNYKFALYEGVKKVDTDDFVYYEPNIENGPHQIIELEWAKGDNVARKKGIFKGLSKDKVYFIYELDDNNNPVLDSSLPIRMNGSDYIPSYQNDGRKDLYDGAIVYSKDRQPIENAFVAGFETSSDHTNVRPPEIHITNTTAYFELPHTGSIGEYPFKIMGIASLLVATTLLKKKRKA